MAILIAQWGRRGGGPRFTYELLRSALLVDSEQIICSSYNVDSDISTDFGGLDCPKMGVSLREGIAGFGLSLLLLPLILIRFVKFIRKERVSFVIVPLESPVLAVSLVVVQLLTGVRVITGVHDATCHPGDPVLTFKAMRWCSLRISSKILVFSHEVAEGLVRKGVDPARLLKTVHPFYGERANRAGRVIDVRANGVKVGFFGRIVDYKGVDLLAEACRIIHANGLLPGFSLEIRGQSTGFPVGSLDVTPFGTVSDKWVDASEIESIVSKWDILVLPYREASQSGVLGLALNLGVPVVATPVGGLKEQVAASGGGLMAADCTPEAIAESIVQLATDAELYSRLSLNGLQAAQSTFSWDVASRTVLQACCDELVRLRRGWRR